MKPATTVLSCAGFLCLRRTRGSGHRDRVDRREVAWVAWLGAEQAAMAGTEPQEVSAQD